MAAGQFKWSVQLQSFADGQDAIGQPTKVWSTYATVKADIRTLNGLESIKADAEQAVTKASIRIRWRTDVTTAHRVLRGATVYAIKAVLPDEAGRKHVDLQVEVVQ